MADVRTWSPTGSKYSCQSQNQGIIWLRWVLMSFKHHRSSASLYLVMPLKQWTWPWLCLEYICQISMSDYSCWKTPVCLKNLNSQVKFLLFFFVLLSVWAVHNQVGVVWDCEEMPVTNPPLLSEDQINAQHSKAWNRKTFPHTGGQNPWHLPDCVVWPHFPLRVLALPNEFFKAAETWWLLKECCPLADSVPGLHFLRKPAVETQFLLARISTLVYLNHFFIPCLSSNLSQG